MNREAFCKLASVLGCGYMVKRAVDDSLQYSQLGRNIGVGTGAAAGVGLPILFMNKLNNALDYPRDASPFMRQIVDGITHASGGVRPKSISMKPGGLALTGLLGAIGLGTIGAGLGAMKDIRRSKKRQRWGLLSNPYSRFL